MTSSKSNYLAKAPFPNIILRARAANLDLGGIQFCQYQELTHFYIIYIIYLPFPFCAFICPFKIFALLKIMNRTTLLFSSFFHNLSYNTIISKQQGYYFIITYSKFKSLKRYIGASIFQCYSLFSLWALLTPLCSSQERNPHRHAPKEPTLPALTFPLILHQFFPQDSCPATLSHSTHFHQRLISL